MIDHYAALGLRPGAEPAEIRAAYLRLARQHHPDRHHAEPAAVRAEHEQVMRRVNAAWEVLGDPERREAHDRDLRSGGSTSSATSPGSNRFTMPAGRSWTPRADDDEWMHDFSAWRDHDERLAEDPVGDTRPSVVIGPIVIATAIVLAFVGVALDNRTLLAVGFAGVLLGAAIMVILPFLELARGRRRDRG